MSKGRKPKIPHSKKVRTLIDELKRRRGERDLQQRFLIVCEDEKSAPNYFKALRRHFGLSGTSVEVASSGGETQPVQIVQRASELHRLAARRNSGTVPFDQVWCVIDGDYGARFGNARARANRDEIKLAISTMCFEYWVLLHFEETGKPNINCDRLVSLLRQRHLARYEKGKCDFKDIVKSLTHRLQASRAAPEAWDRSRRVSGKPESMQRSLQTHSRDSGASRSGFRLGLAF